jgi:hypothetical protein
VSEFADAIPADELFGHALHLKAAEHDLQVFGLASRSRAASRRPFSRTCAAA